MFFNLKSEKIVVSFADFNHNFTSWMLLFKVVKCFLRESEFSALSEA